MTNENPVFKQIDSEISANDIVLFMKGSKKVPQCGFSATVCQVLERLGIKDYRDINVLEDQAIREGIKAYTNWPTIPQLYVKGEFIGGADIIRDMYMNGELKDMLAEKGVI